MRYFFPIVIAFGLQLTGIQTAAAFECNPQAAWRQVRAANPIHRQLLAKCEDQRAGTYVIVLTEPAPHIPRARADAIVRALFTSQVQSVTIERSQLGFEGWADDLVIAAKTGSPSDSQRVAGDLAMLALLNFGSTYKVEVEDIASMTPAPLWDAPAALEVRAEETFNWLLGSEAERLISLEDGQSALLREWIDKRQTGVYYSETPGLVVAIVQPYPWRKLNEQVEELHRFVFDTDVFLGAIKLSSSHVALLGRERTTAFAANPPLRVETLLLLASQRSVQLSQSYERTRAFAGKLVAEVDEFFGWDWAPILLSDEINDTEFGSLLNFTDNMLKGWSESGTISYKGFSHAYPATYPFGQTGAIKTLATTQLTYNWNTAGAGYTTKIGNFDVFAVRNTGSLPVSYFPEGSEGDAVVKSRLVDAEDKAYRYFSSLRNPLLGRAVQYASLYQVFLAFDLRADPPHDPAHQTAAIAGVAKLLNNETLAALKSLSDPSTPTTNYFVLQQAYLDSGSPLSVAKFDPKKVDAYIRERRHTIATTMRELDALSPQWRQEYAQSVSNGYASPDELKGKAELITESLPFVRSPNAIRKAILAKTQRQPDGWIRTPAIVVSKGGERNMTGGHNIGGRATRVIVDESVPKGSVSVSGSYASGRSIRINPADAPQSRDLVRVFDREVGLNDANLSRGASALEARLRQPPMPAHGPRRIAQVFNDGALAKKTLRGAEPSPRALPLGSRRAMDGFSQRIEALAKESGSDVVAVRLDDGGFAVHRSHPRPPVTKVAPNESSFISLLDDGVKRAVRGPPIIAYPKVTLQGMARSEVSLMMKTMESRAKAVAGAGGKPPFNGNKGPLMVGETPEPGGAWGGGRPPGKPESSFWEKTVDGVYGLTGRKNHRIHVVEGHLDMLKVKPRWGEAEIRSMDENTAFLFGAPEHAGTVHLVEIRVPVVLEKPSTFIMRLKSWYKDALSPAKKDEINSGIVKLFKSTETFDAAEAAARIKGLIKDTYQADEIWLNMRLEGGESVTVVEAPAERRIASCG